MTEHPRAADEGHAEEQGHRPGMRSSRRPRYLKIAETLREEMEYLGPAKRSVVEATVTVGELATGSRPVSVGAARGRDAGVGTKFCVLTRGGLWASAHGR